LECGKFDISCSIIANRQIKIEQKMELNFPVLINPEKLRLTYKCYTNNNAKIYLNGSLIEKTKEINGYNRMAIVFVELWQGIGATLMGGGFIRDYNYFEDQAYGRYWW
jgi:hypothetical protein